MTLSKPASAYSAILELVGIRDLAEHDPDSFLRATSAFFTVLTKVFDKKPEVFVYVSRDYCYIQCNNLDQLFDHISNVRFRLLRDHEHFCRGAVVQGFLDAKSLAHPNAKNVIISGMEFSSTASRLYGIQERVKGIGIAVEWISAEAQLISQRCLSTYYVSISSRKKSYIQILDVGLDTTFMSTSNLHRILKNFRRSNTVSRKFASFYIPLLLMWAKSTSLKVNLENEQLDDLICNNQLAGLVKIPGVELVFLCFLNQVFSKISEDPDSEYESARIERLKAFFASSRWLQEIIATDNNLAGVPRDILSIDAKNRFAEFLYG